jgi:hypothetical protein
MVWLRMGMLDDAIREHLELKRRRGADPEEVAREQREALEPIPGLAPSDGGAAEDASELGAEEASSAPLVDPSGQTGSGEIARGSVAGEMSPTAPTGPAPATEAAGAEETAELDMSTVLGDEPRDGPAPSAARTETDPADPGSLEWEMPAEDAAARGEAEEPDEDVLEETPDFLRETPEQERLWFEQQPPRDFDFDK